MGAFIAAIASVVTCIVAVCSMHHQAQLEEMNRKEEHKKWEANFAAQIQLAETNFAAQVQLAETNRQQDFLIWQQQRAQEWTQQLSSLQEQRKNQKLFEKEKLYEDFVFYFTKLGKLMTTLSWDRWKFKCFTEGGSGTFLQESHPPDFQPYFVFLKEQIQSVDNMIVKEQAEVDELETDVRRLMQSVKLTFSPELQKPINKALLELLQLKINMPDTPEMNQLIRQTYKTDTNAWYTLITYYNNELPKHANFEKYDKAWDLVDEMMWREITLEREGIEINAADLTNSAPIILKDGRALNFVRDYTNEIGFRFNTDTNKLQQSELKRIDSK